MSFLYWTYYSTLLFYVPISSCSLDSFFIIYFLPFISLGSDLDPFLTYITSVILISYLAFYHLFYIFVPRVLNSISFLYLSYKWIETILIYIVLNPTHVSFYITNSNTFRYPFLPWLWRVDIDVLTLFFHFYCLKRLSCYPSSTFSIVSIHSLYISLIILITYLLYCHTSLFAFFWFLPYSYFLSPLPFWRLSPQLNCPKWCLLYLLSS